VADADLIYPSWSRRVLGECDKPPHSAVVNPRGETGFQNRVVNCQFRFTDGPALEVVSTDALVENCLFYYIDFSCVGSMSMPLLFTAMESTLRRCTLDQSGCSAAIKVGRLSELNRVSRFGGLQFDGAALQAGPLRGNEGGLMNALMRRNWVHDTTKLSYRFDCGDEVKKPNLYGVMMGNVAWKTRHFQIKGDRHIVVDSTSLGASASINPMVTERWKTVNDETLMANNLCSAIEGTAGVRVRNVVGDARKFLRDPDNLDFRPRAGSPIIDAALSLTRDDLPEGFPYDFEPLPHLGAGPDIGAYEHGAKRYWIPGFQAAHASTPIPPDGSLTARTDCDLMFLEGRGAVRHTVWFGRSPEGLGKIADVAETNIVKPPPLARNGVYYWRVDAIAADGSVQTGPVWTFTCGPREETFDRIAVESSFTLDEALRVDGTLSADEWPNIAQGAAGGWAIGDVFGGETAGRFDVANDERRLYLAVSLNQPRTVRVDLAFGGKNYALECRANGDIRGLSRGSEALAGLALCKASEGVDEVDGVDMEIGIPLGALGIEMLPAAIDCNISLDEGRLQWAHTGDRADRLDRAGRLILNGAIAPVAWAAHDYASGNPSPWRPQHWGGATGHSATVETPEGEALAVTTESAPDIDNSTLKLSRVVAVDRAGTFIVRCRARSDVEGAALKAKLNYDPEGGKRVSTYSEAAGLSTEFRDYVLTVAPPPGADAVTVLLIFGARESTEVTFRRIELVRDRQSGRSR
jgi:hypothetical protein